MLSGQMSQSFYDVQQFNKRQKVFNLFSLGSIF